MQVAKWGNSLAVRLPRLVVDALELQVGDEIEIIVANSRTFAVARKPSRNQILDRLRAYSGRLPEGFRYDRADANAR